MVKRVEGVYPNVREALRAVDRLRDEGYSRNDITVVANEEVRAHLNTDVEANVEAQDGDVRDTNEEDKSLWESIKDAFTTDDSYNDTNYDDPNYDAGNDPMYGHRTAIREGHVAVLVSGGPDLNETTQTETMNHDGSTTTDNKETMELKEERLDIDKKKEKTGEVHVKKNVVEDTETVEVPVTKEEVTIERKPATDSKTGDSEIDSTEEDEIVIPVEEEKVKPKKETDVVEEVEIKKETKQDSETVGDTVRREELEVEEEGKALDNHDENVKQPKDDTVDKEISNDRFDDDNRRNNR